jgi:hypothetical protein
MLSNGDGVGNVSGSLVRRPVRPDHAPDGSLPSTGEGASAAAGAGHGSRLGGQPAAVGMLANLFPIRRLPGLAEAECGPLLTDCLPPPSAALDWLSFLSEPGSAAACGFLGLGAGAALVRPVMSAGGHGERGVFVRRLGRGLGENVMEVAAVVFAPRDSASSLQRMESLEDGQALLAGGPRVPAFAAPMQHVVTSSLVPGGRAPRMAVRFEEGGVFPALSVAAGSLARSLAGEQPQGAARDETRRLVLVRLAFVILHCLASMVAFCHMPSASGKEEMAAPAAWAAAPEPAPGWLASAWVLQLGGGLARVPMPAALGRALLQILESDSTANM